MKNKNRSTLAEAYRKAGPYLGLGVEFTAAILLCFFCRPVVGSQARHNALAVAWRRFPGNGCGLLQSHPGSYATSESTRPEK